jgi:hypothetical protein
MSSPALKLTQLLIRTLAKPIATKIKSQARDHPRFRHLCISIAQRLHRVDMRLRLGLLRDTTANLEKAEKEAAAKRSQEVLKRLKEGSEEAAAAKDGAVKVDGAAAKEAVKEPPPVKAPTPRIRPLSESKAIDAGANFISEFFLFAVAGALIVAESVRSKRKETSRRDTVAERLDLLEQRNRQDEERLAEIEDINKVQTDRILRLEEEIWKLKGNKGEFKGEPIGGREWTPTPLWEPKEGQKGFWKKVWTLGRPGEVKAEESTEGEAAAEGAMA